MRTLDRHLCEPEGIDEESGQKQGLSDACVVHVQSPCLHRLCGFLGGPVACLPCLMALVNHVGLAGRSGVLNLLICLDKEQPCSINFCGNLAPPQVAEMRPS